MSPADELAWELKATARCLELLKDVPPNVRARVVRKLYETFASEEKTAGGKPATVHALVESEEFRASKTAQEQYCRLLALLHSSNPDAFVRAASEQRGRSRVYFAATREEIESLGKSTDPVEISRGTPGTWWADVNCSTEEKRSRLKKIMREMGHPDQLCIAAASAIR